MATVLLVEDDPANAHMVTVILGRAGHQMPTAIDGPGGLETERNWPLDLILLDVSLAGPLNGLDVCRALRAEPGAALTPIMMLSGWAFATDLDAGRAAGASSTLNGERRVG